MFVENVDPDWLAGFGLVIAAAGLTLSFKGCYALKRRSGIVHPWQPPMALVTDGVFQWTRNPGYLGILIALFGVALIFAFDWLLVLIGPTWLILNAAVVRYEEFFLQQKVRQCLSGLRQACSALFLHSLTEQGRRAALRSSTL